MLVPKRRVIPVGLLAVWYGRDYLLLAILLALAIFFAGVSLLRRQSTPLPPGDQPPPSLVVVELPPRSLGARQPANAADRTA
ncbi:MAG TPA: hypothetical protein VFE37_17025 [Chloroflexota bacterium]|nr:hypothetical protein [Chloroflexota bacterium]